MALNEHVVLRLDFQDGVRTARVLDLDRTWSLRTKRLSTRPQIALDSLHWLTAALAQTKLLSAHSLAASRCRSTSSAASFGYMVSGWIVRRTVALVYMSVLRPPFSRQQFTCFRSRQCNRFSSGSHRIF